MKNITHHMGKLEIIGRMPQSANGNPRYKLRVAGFTCVTAVDSQHGYEVPNLDGREVVATVGTHYGKPTLNTVKRGN